MMYEQLIPHYKGVHSEEVVKQRGFPAEYVVSERVMHVAPPAPSPRIPAELQVAFAGDYAVHWGAIAGWYTATSMDLSRLSDRSREWFLTDILR